MIMRGKIFVRHQVSLGASDTIASKHSVEREARSQGIIVKKYRADNGIFSSEAFEHEVEEHLQRITFSGVGAQHQNAVAERAIGVVQIWPVRCSYTYAYVGPTNLTLHYGPLPYPTLCGFITVCPIQVVPI